MTGSGPSVVLLSGGLDSTTTLAVARAEGHEVHALSFRYGQRHEHELACAARQAERFGCVAHEVVDLSDLGRLVAPATSLVAGSDLEVPKNRAPAPDIPTTYVPARNTVFLSYALAWSEVIGGTSVWIGVNAVDYSGYPDCRPAYLEAFERMARLATRAGLEGEQEFRVRAPLLPLHKHEIIALGHEHGVDFRDTLSCYDPVIRGAEALACGACDSCQLRRQGFEQAGVADPTLYV